MNKALLSNFATLAGAAALLHGPLSVLATPIQVPGFLKFEVYTNIPGGTVADLEFADSYPDSPGRVFYMTSFDTRPVYRDDTHENYGGRISGFITPTESGEYEFFLRSDDASRLSLSPDDDPANLVTIAEETAGGGVFEETGAPETSAPRSLQAGQRYAIEALYKESAGVDLCQVAWRRVGDPTPAANLSPIPSAFLSAFIPPRGGVSITRQPTGATVGANEFINLSVGFTATHGPIVIQWQRDGVNVPGVVGDNARLGPLSLDQAGRYRAVVSIPGALATSAEVVVDVTPDTTPPAIISVLTSDSLDMLTVDFSEHVMAAGDPFNYALVGDATLVGDPVVLSPTQVRLTTTPLTLGGTYTLEIVGIVDLANNVAAEGTSFTFSTLDRVRGGLKFETWFNIGGNAVSGLTSDPRYPASPDLVAYVTKFTSRLVFADAASMDNYGGRMSGWIVPPETAEYEFFIRSDDDSELWLSTDADPANATLIAMGVCCGPFAEPPNAATSTAISLTEGTSYYIHALWKEGGGGDYCDVAWRKVGTPGPAIDLPFISGDVLETFAVPGAFTPPTVAFSSPVNGSTFDTTDAVTLIANASAAPSKSLTRVEFLQQGRVIETVTNSPYTVTLYELREDNHTFIARATDSTGMFTDSTPVTISVGVPLERVTLAAIDDVTTWRYDRTGRDLGTEWREAGYDDSTWPEGKALIADEGTATVEPIRTRISRFNDLGEYVRTFYFRTHFNFDRPITPIVKLRLRHAVDDAVLIYLNGMEIHRFGIAPDVVVDYLTDAAGHENAYEGPYDIPLDHLLPGDNVLAAEVHQAGGGSSDMVFGVELIATVPVIRPTLTVTREGGSVRISWTPAGGTLESAPAIDGSWSAVADATNPYLVTADQAARFYRVSR